MAEPLLNLDTLIERPSISIDGARYEIVSPEELPVITSYRLASRGRRFDKLMALEQLSEHQDKELGAIVRELSDIIMAPVPEQARIKLTEAQRLSVIEVFTTLLLRRRLGTAAAAVKDLAPALASRIGEMPSPASSGSTAGTPAGGSPKPRSPS